MIKTDQPKDYYPLFDAYPVFHNFIKYACQDLSPAIYVDQIHEPSCLVLYAFPAYFILGKPNPSYVESVCQLIQSDAWVITADTSWDTVFNDYYKNNIQTHARIQFDSSQLNLEHILSLRKPLPPNLSVVPINETHISNGMIYDDVISRFFTQSSFKDHGYGFALVDEHNDPKGFALTNYPIIGQEIELYFRVGYNYDVQNRNQGIGTTLCTYFIEETLKRGLIPIWDSANEVSAHIARKLGFIEMIHWSMYHIR